MLYHEIIAGHPDEKAALIFKDSIMTYGELRSAVESRACFLQAKGLAKGDRVGLLSKNCPDFAVSYLAVIRAGGVVVPFNFQLAAREIIYIVKDADLKLMLVRQKIDLAEAAAEIGCEEPLQLEFAEMAGMSENALIDYELHENDNCTIIYTSGTTGKPKGAMLTHRNLVANTREFTGVIPLYADDIALVCFTHVPLLCLDRVGQRALASRGQPCDSGDLHLQGYDGSDRKTRRQFLCRCTDHDSTLF